MGNDTPAGLGALHIDEGKLEGHVDSPGLRFHWTHI
jgi:hypothetical protein